MPDPAKLELLTRGAEPLGFEVHEIQSSQAYLQFRPRRAAEAEWDLTPQPYNPDGSRNYILKSLRRDRYLLLSPKEYFLWEQFEGRHSVTEIARAFHFEFGSFDYPLIGEFMAKLYYAGLLQELEPLGLHRALAARDGEGWAQTVNRAVKAWRRMSFRLTDADRYASILYRRGGFFLFHPISFAASIALAIFALVAIILLTPDIRRITFGLAARPFLTVATMIATYVVVSMFHVLVHALACKSYGRKVREIGFFFLQGILPTFYADVTDVFMSNRRARVMVNLAGPMVEVVFGSVAFLAAYASDPGIVQSLFFGSGILLWEGALLNLYPFNFLEMDGYNMVADLLAMPALRQQAWALLPTVPRRLRNGEAFERSEWIQLGYLVLCFISVLVYLIVHLDAVASATPVWHLKT